jgi:hypothetical protein
MNSPGVDMCKIKKAVVLQKPEGWDDSLEVQEKLFNIITSRFIWLCIREEKAAERNEKADVREWWLNRFPTFLECFWNTVVKAFSECIDQFGYSVRYEPCFYHSLQLSEQLFASKEVEGYETVFELLDYIYILEDTYRVYDYEDGDIG